MDSDSPSPHDNQPASAYRALRIEHDGPVAEVVLIGPGKGNSMGPDFWREMPEAFTALDRDEQVRAIIVRGAGQHFSYGLDLPAMASEPGIVPTGEDLAAERTRIFDTILRMQEACNRVAACRKPVIAAISGWCIGAGLDLIAACDVRLCSEDARFSLREVRVAIVADMGSLQRLPRIIGQGNTREMAFTGKDIDADRAAHMGLVNEVFTTPQEVLDAARTMARQIADNPPLVVQGIKRVLDECQDLSLADGLRYVALWNAAFMHSHDLQEAFAAFVERRAPHFEGR